MKKTLLLLSLIYIGQTKAQVCFSSYTNFTTNSNPESIISVDVNGDGKIDLVTANNGSSNISVLLGTGTGNFNPQTNFVVGANPRTVISADFNGDGNVDLATANDNNSGTISVLIGAGNGNFGAAATYSVGSYAASVVSADFNGDGKADLASANFNSNDVSILLGTGSGSFGLAVNLLVDTGPVSLISADFNIDGFADLAVTNETSSKLSILLGTGTGSFGAVTNYAVGTNPCSVISTDFNGDGKPDLAVSNLNSGNVSILLGTGTGGFALATNFLAGSLPYTVTSGDFNHDGKKDFATSNAGTNNVSVLLGTGNGSFGTATNFGVGGFNSAPWSIISADFNGDSKADLATSNNGLSNLSVLLNCTPTPTCVASISDSLYKDIMPLTWDISAHYSSQVNNAIWYWGDGTSSSGLYPSHTYTTSGWYSICATVYTSCGDSASTCRNDTLYKMANTSSMVTVNILANTTNINHHALSNNQISVYPNPTSDQFFIDTNTNDKLTVDLYDVNGRHVFSKSVSDKSNIDVASLNEGIYTLTIKTADRVTNKKLVILR